MSAPASSHSDSMVMVDVMRLRAHTSPPSRAPRRRLRAWHAYLVTARVIASYSWWRVRARVHGEAWRNATLTQLHLLNARRIERAICQLQGLFIKVGQVISIMTNFLPEAFRRELEGLQDAVPPRPFPDIEARLREELGAGPETLFAAFEPTPIASASIGQVHLARLHTGEKVAVKVQYPNIETLVQSDLRTLRRIFRIVEWFVSYRGLDEVYREIRAIVTAELDYRAEAENAATIAANFQHRTDVCFPQVIAERSTARVLTTKFEAGPKISDLAALRAMQVDRSQLARKVVELYCQQIFVDGIYHADPHPGNILVRMQPDAPTTPQLVFLDFGAVARIPGNVRQGMIDLVQGALARDSARIIRAMRQMGFVARGADERVFEQVIEYFHSRFQQSLSLDSLNLKDVKFDPQKGLESLADLRQMDISLRELSASFHIPKEIIVLERTMLLIMGLCTELDPGLNPTTVIRPYLERFVLGDDGDWSTVLVDASKDVMLNITALPSELRKLMRVANQGALEFRVANLESASRNISRTGQQLMLVAVGIAGAAIAIVLEGRGELERAAWGWWTTKGATLAFAWSWWNSRRHT